KIAMQYVFRFGSKHISEAACHARTKIQAERSQNQDHSSGHIFATVLADAFDHGQSAAVTDGKPFARTPRYEQLPGRRAVQDGVSGQDVTAPRSARAGSNRDGTARQALSHVVVRFALKAEVDAGTKKSGKTLACATMKLLRNRSLSPSSCRAVTCT